MRKVFVVIPVFNEEKIIGRVIKDVKKAGYKNIIIIDDNSSDKTFSVAKKHSVVTLHHFINRGKGGAIKTGIKAAQKMGAEIIVTIDGDGQHNPANIDKMIKLLSKGYDVILGSRLKNSKSMPITRLLFNVTANLVIYTLYGFWVSDSQSGFRAYSKKAFQKIETKKDRYEYDSEVIREIAKHKLSFIEIPIDVRYTKYSTQKIYKQSLFNGIKMFFRMIAI